MSFQGGLISPFFEVTFLLGGGGYPIMLAQKKLISLTFLVVFVYLVRIYGRTLWLMRSVTFWFHCFMIIW